MHQVDLRQWYPYILYKDKYTNILITKVNKIANKRTVSSSNSEIVLMFSAYGADSNIRVPAINLLVVQLELDMFYSK